MNNQIANLYQAHVKTLLEKHQSLLEQYAFEHLIIPSGEPIYVFQDDHTYPFKTSAYFKWFVPLTNHPNSYLSIPQSGKPTLIYYLPKDYWHAVPELPDADLFQQFDIQIISKPDEALKYLPTASERVAYLGESPSAFEIGEEIQFLPEPLLSELHWLRAYKSEYEFACLYQASLFAAKAHSAAKQAFYSGGSEMQIHNAYLAAIKTKETDLPYTNIIALNENPAILHYTEMQNIIFPESKLRSFLIDAGGSFHGYAADITRTYAYREGAFANMIELMDQKQLEVIEAITVGMPYPELHILTHHKVAEVLREFGLITCSAEDAVNSQITSTFLPHGLGHHLGLHVHDAGGHQASPTGGVKAPTAPHNYLRNTRNIEVDNYFTIEPGLYFIPQLLNELKQSDRASLINWTEVGKYLPFGGIRIEDNIRVGESSTENYSRMAFSEI